MDWVATEQVERHGPEDVEVESNNDKYVLQLGIYSICSVIEKELPLVTSIAIAALTFGLCIIFGIIYV